MERLPGVRIPDERLDKWPNFDVLALGAEEDLAVFTTTIDWVLQQARQHGRACCSAPPAARGTTGAARVLLALDGARRA